MKLFLSYDAIGDNIIDSFPRKTEKAAIRDFKNAFREQAKDDSEVILFKVCVGFDFDKEAEEVLDGIPVKQIWSSKELETEINEDD